MFKDNCIGYVEKESFLGNILSFNFLTKELEMISYVEGKAVKKAFHMEDVEILKSVYSNKDKDEIFDKDILTIGNKLYKVELIDDETLQFHHVNEKYEVLESGEKLTKDELVELFNQVAFEVAGNYYELKDELENAESLDLDFNVKIIRIPSSDGKEYNYLYACNDKENEVVDLIKVLFLGAQLLEEDNYSRVTFDYDEYAEVMSEEEVEEVSPQELMQYVNRVMRGQKHYANSEPQSDLTEDNSEQDCCDIEVEVEDWD